MREHFDLNPRLIYLNSGTHSILPRFVRNAVVQYLIDYERDPTLQLMRIWPRIWRIQERLADFLGADAMDLFIAPNVTYAMNQFILGAPVPKGKEIVHTNLEYGAVQKMCRLRAERDGIPLRTIQLPTKSNKLNELGEDGMVELIIGQLTPNTEILVLSHVFMSNGYILPIEKLAKETRKMGVQLIVDGAHAPGSLALNFKDFLDIDYYSGNLHKWVMGPKGTAFGWVAKRRQEKLMPIVAGWTTFDPPPVFSSFGGEDSFASKFLNSACYDFSPILALAATFDFWEMLGPEKIRQRIYELQAFTEQTISEKLGWKTISPDRPFRGPLLSYELPERWQETGQKNIFRVEREYSLVIGVPYCDGRWVIRLSPHIYNTEAEIERAVEILKISMA